MTHTARPTILHGQSIDTRIIRYSTRTIRVTHKRKNDPAFPTDRPWFGDVVIGKQIEKDQPGLEATLVDDCLQVMDPVKNPIMAENSPAEIRENGSVCLHFDIQEDEGLYGFGEWFNGFRRTAGRLKFKIRDSIAILQGRYTYSTLPLFLSDRNYAVFILNSHLSEGCFSQQGRQLRMRFEGPSADYLLITGGTPKEILSEYTRLTGRPPLLPRWAYGLWVTSYPQESQQKVLDMIEEHRARNIPLDGVILDYHWEQRYHDFRWRKSLFPDPGAFLSNLKDLGIHLGLIFTPFANHTNLALQKSVMNLLVHNLPDGVEEDDERDLVGYKEGHDKGYFADNDAAWWFGKGGMVDFTNPDAAAWWNRKLEPLYNAGVSFFKNDDGEYLPLRARSANGMDGHEYHNLYGFYYGRAIYEGMQNMDDRRALIYARSVWAGSQRHPAIFLGDQVPTFGNLRRILRAGLNMSLMGFTYWSADVFGLSGRTSAETHMRYAQWTLLNPIARYFWRPERIDPTRKPWSHNPKVLESFKRHLELRYRLLPYFHLLGWEAWQTGIPMMRPLWLEFPGDERLLAIYDQVMLGDSLMLCPVVKAGARSREVTFPEGTWYDYWTGRKIEGGQTSSVDAPVDRLPLYVRGGSILPMGALMQFIPDDHRFEQLALHFHPPFNAERTFLDDDPNTRAYQSGKVASTTIRCVQTPKGITVVIGKAIGNASLAPPKRELDLVFHDLEAIRAVQINGRPAKDWEYQGDLRTGRVHLVQPANREVEIVLVQG